MEISNLEGSYEAVRAHVCEDILSGRVLGREGGKGTFQHREQLYKDQGTE